MSRYALSIALKDLKRIFKAPLSLVSMLMLPIVITVIVGFTFGTSGDVEIPRIKVLLDDEDGGILPGFIRQSFQKVGSGKMVELVDTKADEGRRLIDRGKASAFIVIPKGSSSALLDKKPIEFLITKNPSELFLPAIVEEILKTDAVMLDGAVRLFGEPLDTVRTFLKGEHWPSGSELSRVFALARRRFVLITPYISDSLITVQTVRAGEKNEGGNFFALIFPGSMIIGLLFISMIAQRDIVKERARGTLKRVLSGPTSAGEFIIGKVMYNFFLTSISLIVLLVIARLVFGIGVKSPLALAVVSLGTALLSSGLVILPYGLIRSERAAVALMPSYIIVLCLMGGAMMPYETMSRLLKEAARYSPVFWVVDAFKRVMFLGVDMGDIMRNIEVINIVGILSILIGTAVLKRRAAKGL